MQCPNCKKEAINVNGKYVCLDCGIEISPADAAPPTAETGPVPTVATPQIITSGTSIPEDQPTELSVESSPTPGMVVPEPVTPEPVTPVENQPIPTVASITPETPDLPQTPVMDEIVSELSQANQSSLAPQNTSPVPPDFPVAPVETQQAAPEITTPPFVSPQVDVSPEPTLPSTSAPEAPFVPQLEITPTDNQPVEYFQPSEINIASNPEAATAAALGQSSLGSMVSSPEPVPTTTPEPQLPDPFATSIPEPVSPGVPLEIINPTVGQPQAAESLDSLLNQAPQVASSAPALEMSPVANPNLEPVEDIFGTQPTAPAPSLDSVSSPAQAAVAPATQPAPEQVPSYESVFGAQPATQGNIDAVKASPFQKYFTKKNIIIMAVALVLVFLVITVLVFMATRNNNSEPQPVATVDQAVISQRIQEAMEGSLSASVSFDQGIDFSALKLTTAAASTEKGQKISALIKEKTAQSTGLWQVSSDGDISVEKDSDGVTKNLVFLKSENGFYESSDGGSSWAKKSTAPNFGVPSFFAPVSRAKLFYVAQSDLAPEGKEEFEGTEYEKYKVSPKTEFLQNIISESHPALSEVNFTEINSENLSVEALINSQNQIVKISVQGDVQVTSEDFEEGSIISFKSEAIYEYQEQIKIEKPESSQAEELSKVEEAPKPIADVEVEPTIIKVSGSNEETEEKPKGRG